MSDRLPSNLYEVFDTSDDARLETNCALITPDFETAQWFAEGCPDYMGIPKHDRWEVERINPEYTIGTK